MSSCPYPVIEHRFRAAELGDWNRITITTVTECPDPDCDGDPQLHTVTMPCRWSWPYARGKAAGGPFPTRRCLHCQHIRRAGEPAHAVADELADVISSQ